MTTTFGNGIIGLVFNCNRTEYLKRTAWTAQLIHSGRIFTSGKGIAANFQADTADNRQYNTLSTLQQGNKMEYTQWKTARPVTCKLLAMMEEGTFDPHELAKLVLNWLSEDEVAELAEANQIQFVNDGDDKDDEDDSSEHQEDVTEYDNVSDCHDEHGSRDQ